MKCLVTGGAGFIGSHICEYLAGEGHEVISVDNYVTGKRENHVAGVKYIEADVLDALDEVMHGVDVIYNNAASKKTVCLKDPRKDLDTNAKGTFNLLELAVKHKVKRFVHASTGSVYGEPQYAPQDERHPLNPVSYYGVSKLAGERYVEVYRKMYRLSTTILRYFHVYGPRQDSSGEGGVVAIFADRIKRGKPITIFGTGDQERSFTYVGDVVKANMVAGEGVYNVASGRQFTLKQLIRAIEMITGKKAKIRYDKWQAGDIREFDVCNRKIIDLMKFTPFFDGLKMTI